MLTALLIALGLAVVLFLALLLRAAIAASVFAPNLEAVAVGAVVNFFDTLGIGSFAPTLAWLKFRTRLPDRLIPCTMIVACTLPIKLQAAIFLALLGVHIDPILMVVFAMGLVAGALVGARLVLKVRVWIVQATVAGALVIASILYGLSNLHIMPVGGLATALPLPLTILATATSVVLGILLNFGVGHYAPSLIMLSLMGLDPKLAFSIMATGGAFAAAMVSGRYFSRGAADLRIVIGFMLGGVPGVLIAALIVKDMPVEGLRSLVIVVVLYAAATMAREAVKAFRQGSSADDEIALARTEGLSD